jgi:peptidoglycan/LPS O-acetylase OafA/YrhL
MNSGGPEHRPFFTRVESLRGLGAFAVAGWHMSGWRLNGVQLFEHTTWNAVDDIQRILGRIAFVLVPGHAALMMFFVISGYVLRVSLRYGPQPWIAASRRFAVARAFRIYPIVIVGTLLAAWAAGWQIGATADRAGAPPSLSTLVANMLLVEASINSTLWALQLEVLMVPVILAGYFLERAYGTGPLIAAAFVTTVLSFTKQWTFWPPLSHFLFAFLIGMLIPTVGATLAKRLPQASAQKALIASVCTLITVGQVLGFYSQLSTVAETYAAAALICLVTYRSDLKGAALLDSRMLRQAGLCSGSFYVLHMPLLPFFVAAAAPAVPPSWSAIMPLGAGILVVAACLIAFVPLMLASYHPIEAPGIALGKWLNRRIERSRRKEQFTSAT